MALALPDLDDLYTFWGDTSPVTSAGEDPDVDARATIFLQASADLLYLATGLDSTPTDARQRRLVNYAIEDMAIYLFASREDIAQEYSPFTGETIGSYSYTKKFTQESRFTKAAINGETGVPFFDLVVSSLLDGIWDTQPLELLTSSPFAGLYDGLFAEPSPFIQQDPSDPSILLPDFYKYR